MPTQNAKSPVVLIPCEAHVPVRQYSPAGRCAKVLNVRLVRWAPTPLTTVRARLCAFHRSVLERGGAVQIQRVVEREAARA